MLVDSGVNPVGFGTCPAAQPTMLTVYLGLSLLLQHPHLCLPSAL